MVGLLGTLGILAVVKYTNFVIYNINSVRSWFSLEGIRSASFLLPLGISFYTFQTVGYLIDVYRGDVKVEKNIIKLAVFTSFFPQLIQGPISRFNELSQTLYVGHSF